MMRNLMRWMLFCMSMTVSFLAHPATLRTTTLVNNGTPYEMPYYGNKALTTSMPAIKRVVVVVHGAGRDGNDEFTTTNNQLINSGANRSEILLIVPQMYNGTDANAGLVGADTPYWRGSGWIYGYDSRDGRQLSSFAMMDQLVAKLTDASTFPNLTQIVLAGHSGGGQFFSRYAALTDIHATVRPGVLIKYVIANPGSHMWFNLDRPVGSAADGATAFAPYSDTASCPDFNTYKYGLENMSADQPFSYPVSLSAAELFDRFARRQMYYYQGTADTVPYTSSNHNPPDADCGAVLGGDYRFARGVTNARYQRYLAAMTGVPLNRLFRRVEGVAHDSGGMYGSVCASTALFGTAQMLNTQGATCSDLN